MINIHMDSVESNTPQSLRNLAGLLLVIATYTDNLLVSEGQTAENDIDVGTYQINPSENQTKKEKSDFDNFKSVESGARGAEVVFRGPTESLSREQEPKLTPHQLVTGIDTDTQGLPWDGRIHSSSRAKNADGSWRARRNLDDDVVKRVEQELHNTMSATPTQVPPPPFASAAIPPVPTGLSSPTEGPVGIAATASPSNENLFVKLTQKITGAYAAGTLAQDQIQAALAAVGVPALPMLMHRPDLIGVVATKLGLAL